MCVERRRRGGRGVLTLWLVTAWMLARARSVPVVTEVNEKCSSNEKGVEANEKCSSEEKGGAVRRGKEKG